MWNKKFDGSELQFEENGVFQLSVDAFCLKQNHIRVAYDGTEEPIVWRKECEEEKRIRFHGREPQGEWTVEFRFGRDGELFLHFRGTRKQTEKRLTIVLLDFQDLEADHLLGQGMCMGHCTSLLFPLNQERSFTSYYQTMITKDGENRFRLPCP